MTKIYVLKTFEWNPLSPSDYPEFESNYYHKTEQGAIDHANTLGLTINDYCLDPMIHAMLEVVDLLD